MACNNCEYCKISYDNIETTMGAAKCMKISIRGKTITWAMDLYKSKKGIIRVQEEIDKGKTPHWCPLKKG